MSYITSGHIIGAGQLITSLIKTKPYENISVEHITHLSDYKSCDILHDY